MIRTDVIGARTMPAKTAPTPTTANAPMESAEWWNTVTSRYPTAPPSMAPMKSAGAKMPPEPPLAYELTVEASLRTQKTAMAVTVILPVSARVRVLYGSPAMPLRWKIASAATAIEGLKLSTVDESSRLYHRPRS